MESALLFDRKQLYELSDNTYENAMVVSCRLWYLRQSVCDCSPCMVKNTSKMRRVTISLLATHYSTALICYSNCW